MVSFVPNVEETLTVLDLALAWYKKTQGVQGYFYATLGLVQERLNPPYPLDYVLVGLFMLAKLFTLAMFYRRCFGRKPQQFVYNSVDLADVGLLVREFKALKQEVKGLREELRLKDQQEEQKEDGPGSARGGASGKKELSAIDLNDFQSNIYESQALMMKEIMTIQSMLSSETPNE